MASAQRVEPVGGFRFGVSIGDKGVIQAWFTECSGLTIERETFPHKEGGVNDFEHKLPGRVKQSNITLKRGVSGPELWQWFREGLYDGKVKRSNISIILLSGDRREVKRWDFLNAYPIKWSGPDLKTDSNQVAIETIEFVHEGMEVADWKPSVI